MTDFQIIYTSGVAIGLVVGSIWLGVASARKWLDFERVTTFAIICFAAFLIFMWPLVVAGAAVLIPLYLFFRALFELGKHFAAPRRQKDPPQ